LSPTMTEGKIVKWLKKEGDSISSGEAIAEVETDKSNLEVEAFDDGVLLKIIVPEGETGKVGAPIAVIGQKGEKVEASAAPAKAAAPAPAPAPAPPKAPPAAASAAPTPPPKPAPKAPPPAQVVPIRRAEEPPPSASEENGRLRASPLAKRMARDEGLDLAGVQGSGPSGRIVKRDVEAAIGQAGQAGQAAAVAKAPAAPRPAPVTVPMFGRREPDVVAISGMRKIISQRMAEVKPGVPHFYVTVDIEMEEAAKVREQAKAAEVKVSFNDLIVKAAAMALRRQPKVNVSLQGDRILQFHTADVGIAVAIEDGLITPVIRDADQKSLGTIAAEARELAERARRKALKPEEYAGGSITVSNLGMFGVDNFIAVINPPQASIVAVGAVAEKPVVRDGKVVVRKMMSATFSGDHRIVDGALGAQYLQELKTLLEQPTRLLF
ncbi:MAG TPA: pyruvate dehydrogenase complex dihydrolipoamide acetyltransferase, partial [Myxococcaceae bacterium]